MLTDPDLIELLSIFRSYEVRFLVVGGYAVIKYTEPRYTKDLDLWIERTEHNAERVYAALKSFGAPLQNLTPKDFTQAGYFYQMGTPPIRVDIVMSIAGIEFQEAWERRVESKLEGISIPFISLPDLIQNKRAAGRPQDLIDVERLEKAGPNDKTQ